MTHICLIHIASKQVYTLILILLYMKTKILPSMEFSTCGIMLALKNCQILKHFGLAD